jgi:hypothetical protein
MIAVVVATAPAVKRKIGLVMMMAEQLSHCDACPTGLARLEVSAYRHCVRRSYE